MPSSYILTPEGNFVNESELYHYGVLGMKWGVRRYQNPDGTLTAAGKKRGTAYEYRSHATNVYAKKAKKAAAKGRVDKANKYKTYEKRSANLDKEMFEYAKTVSYGKAVAQLLLTNSRTYAATKFATGNDGNISRAVGYANSYLTGGLGDMAVRALYVRQD